MKLRYSALATADLLQIGRYTAERWGEKQARHYLEQLRRCAGQLQDTPLLGRSCIEVRSGLRRIEQGKHVIFYRVFDTEVKVTRVLHQRTLPAKANFGSR